MKSYTRKQMLEAKAKLIGSRQEVNRQRKMRAFDRSYHKKIVAQYCADLNTCGEELKKANELLQVSQKKKWYQFEAI